MTVVEPTRQVELPRSTLWLGRVDVSEQVVGYERRRVGTSELLGYEDLDLPPARLQTVAYWYTLSPALLDAAALDPRDIPGAAHAAEHAQIGLLPLFAMCDRWDIGGLSTAWHPDTGAATIFVYDGYPGGAGIAEVGPPPSPGAPPRHPRHRRLLPLRDRLPLLRPVPQVRQRQQPPGQGGRRPPARRAAGRSGSRSGRGAAGAESHVVGSGAGG